MLIETNDFSVSHAHIATQIGCQDNDVFSVFPYAKLKHIKIRQKAKVYTPDTELLIQYANTRTAAAFEIKVKDRNHRAKI